MKKNNSSSSNSATQDEREKLREELEKAMKRLMELWNQKDHELKKNKI